MNRKLLIVFLCILLSAVVAFTACGQKTQPTQQTQPTQTQGVSPTQVQSETITLIFEHKIPSTHALADNETAWIKAVEKASNGRIKFDEHWGEEPVPGREMLSGCGKGVIDIINTVATYHSGEVGIADFTLMPSAFRTPDDLFELWYDTELGSIVDKVYRERANVTVLYPFANFFGTEALMVGKKSKQVEVTDDLVGMKIRAAGGSTDEAIKLLGGSPVTLIAGEMYNALQSGTIDAVMIPAYTMQSYKLWEICSQIIDPPICEVCTNMMFMNLDVWNKLPADVQKIFQDVARDYTLFDQQVKRTHNNTAQIRATATGEYGVKNLVLSEAEANKMYEKIDPVWDFYVNNNAKQGKKAEAEQIRNILSERFNAN
jgi:TRAP-type C4-dicarboxylate transport system substrate-binding protein